MSWITTRRYAWPILVALAIFAGLNAAASPAFTDSGNWNGMLIGAAPFIITAMAQTAVVMSGDGGVDLSVGPLAGLVNALIASVLVPHGWTDPVSIVGGTLLVGVASGLLNGIMVAVVRVQPIIATLGTYLAYQGITLEMMPMAGGQAPDWLVAIANSRGGVPGVLVAAYVVKSLPLYAVRWLVIVVVVYTAVTMLVAATKEEPHSQLQH